MLSRSTRFTDMEALIVHRFSENIIQTLRWLYKSYETRIDAWPHLSCYLNNTRCSVKAHRQEDIIQN